MLLSGGADGLLEAARRAEGAPAPGPALADAVRRALDPLDPDAWTLRTRGVPLRRPLVMGIVNVTPDSFSDGGLWPSTDAAAAHGRELAAAGADLLDVGGESTRPGSRPVPPDEERRRVLPVVAALAPLGVPISVDTTRAALAREALAAGAEVVNDVSALRFDPGMAAAVAETGAGLVLMHMRGTPATMQDDPRYVDVAGEVLEFLGEALAVAVAAGVDRDRVAVDPGIGFGKRSWHNLELLYRVRELRVLGAPVLVGPSRKGFLDPGARFAPAERVPETLAACCLAALGGARILRVHDVGDCRRALEIVHRVGEFAAGEAPAPTV
ncbi:MAG TPA: dihydropteroate synthase [Gemmatimonadota bacterium]